MSNTQCNSNAVSHLRWTGHLLLLAALLLPSAAFAHDMTEIARERMAEGGFLNVMWTGAERRRRGQYKQVLMINHQCAQCALAQQNL